MTTREQASWDMAFEPALGSVVLRGEFDLRTTPAMCAAYSDAVDGFEAPVRFDLRGVTFADSTLAHALQAADAGRRRHGQALSVRVTRSSRVARLLVWTGLAETLDVRDERDVAVAR